MTIFTIMSTGIMFPYDREHGEMSHKITGSREAASDVRGHKMKCSALYHAIGVRGRHPAAV